MRHSKAVLSTLVGVSLAWGALVSAPLPAAADDWKDPAAQEFAFVDTRSPKVRKTAAPAVRRASSPAAAWPEAGSGSVSGLRAGDRPAQVGALPVSIGVPSKAKKPVSAAEVRVMDRVHSEKLVGPGVVFAVTGEQASAAQVSLDYSSFASAAGGGFGARLRLVQLPECALSDPANPSCQAATPLKSTRSEEDSTVSASVALPAVTTATSTMVLAAVAGASGDQGNYAASPLSSASSWQSGGSTGSFSWSYPMRTPPVAGSVEPEIELSYDSGSTDGEVAASNNQASWVGEGFNLPIGFIERTYTPCAGDKPDKGSAPAAATDACWYTDGRKSNDRKWDNATVSFKGHSGTLVRVGNTDQWRLKADDGTRFERVGSVGSAGQASTEYWKMTTSDGVQYFFGKGKADGASATATNSRWMLPVAANQAGEPGYNADFAQSFQNQAWRWNLDYVVDPSGDTMTVYYDKETNKYKQNGQSLVSYDRGGIINRIQYGERRGEESVTPAAKVTFVAKERCDTTVSATCESTQPTAATVTAWPDVPTDAICDDTYCPSPKNSPTYFSRKRLAEVHTWTRNASNNGYDPVDTWNLTSTFPATNDGTSTPTLWLSSITHVGEGGTSVTLPAVTLEPAVMRNRISGPTGTYGMSRPRLWRITDEAGARTTVSYSGEDCTPTTLPQNPATNTTRCFPSYYSPDANTAPSVYWFAKYVVEKVEVYDRSTETIGLPAVSGVGLATSEVTTYAYGGGAAWHWDDSPLLPDDFRTWSEWRGYEKVTAIEGNTDAPRSVTETTWFRGMNGDRSDVGGTQTKSVTVSDSAGGSVADDDVLAGQLRETRVLKSVGGDPVGRSIEDPWVSPTAAASDGRDQAIMVDTAKVTNTQFLTSGSRSQTQTIKERDAWGQPTVTEDTGDTGLSGDESCTRTAYATPTGNALATDLISEQSIMPALCSQNPTEAAVLGWARHYYDGSNQLGQVTGPGFETQTKVLSGSANRQWVTSATSAYDIHGRKTSGTDALGRTGTIAYSPTTVGAARQITTTSPDPDGAGPGAPLVSQLYLDPRWGAVTKAVAASGVTAESTLDALGRVTATWLPGRDKATQSASVKYTYVVNQGSAGINATKTESLLPSGSGYATQWSILDSLLRVRQVKTQALSAGTQVQDTRYDSRGNAALVDEYIVSGDPTSTLIAPTYRANIKRSVRTTYDYASRPLVNGLYKAETLQWQTTKSYVGDRVSVDPPQGGTPTTTVTDIHGRTTQLIQHLGEDNSGTAVTTSYNYNPAGLLDSMTDAKGNKWSYTYDLQGNRLTVSDPDAGVSTSTYDVLGRLISSTDSRGKGTRFAYDDLDRLTGTTSLDGATQFTSTVYDTVKPGLVTSSSRFVAGSEFKSVVNAYDSAGRSTSSSMVVPTVAGLVPAGIAGTYTSTRTFKPDGSIDTVSLPATGPVAAETLTYGYTSRGATTSLTGAAAIVKTTAYTQWDTISSLSMGAVTGQSISESFTRDETTLRLTQQRTYRQVSGSSADEDMVYTYDPAGNLTQLKASLKSGPVDNQCFKYDFQGQLVEAFTAASSTVCSPTTTPSQTTLGTGPAPYWTSWSIDTIGKTTQRVDRTASTSSTTAFTYAADGASSVRPHAVASAVTTGAGAVTRSYVYDAAGNTTERPGPSGVTQTVAYDDEGLPVSVSSGGNEVARMVYDAFGERILKKEGTLTTLSVAGTELSVDATSGVVSATRYYEYGGQTVATRTGNTNADLFTVITDHQGSAHHQIRNSDSRLVTTWQGPFGVPRGSAASSWVGQRGFVGGTNDATGLVRLGARDYDPLLGKFLTVDPLQNLGDPLQWNAYIYANNSPVTHSDPSGLMLPSDPGSGCMDLMSAGSSSGCPGDSPSKPTKPKKPKPPVKKKVKPAPRHDGPTPHKPTPTNPKLPAPNPLPSPMPDVDLPPGFWEAFGHTVLDLAGLIPVVGIVFDVANAIWYAAEGDWLDAGISLLGVVPVLGELGVAAKIGSKIAKTFKIGEEAIPAAKALIPDETVIARGGVNDIPGPGEVFSGAQGKSVEEAAAGLKHGTMRTTTAGDIRRSGGTVEAAPEFDPRVGEVNYQHVDVCLGPGVCKWSDLTPNPVPKANRFGGLGYPYYGGFPG